MNRITTELGVLLVFFVCSTAFAQLDDDFESYTLGNIDGQGNWIDFGGVMANEVSSELAFSGNQSLKQTIGPIAGNPVVPGYGSDLFLDLPLKKESGQWQLSYQLYVPASFNGAAALLASEGFIAEEDFDVGTFLVADGTTGFDEFFLSIDGGNPESSALRLVRNQWVEVKSAIDLDTNVVDVFYNGSNFYSGPWDPANSTPGIDDEIQSIGGLNLWVQGGNGGSVYYDDIKLSAVPEPACVVLLLFGFIGLLLRIRR